MSAFTPTPEQTKAVDLFAKGQTMVIEAGAGTGKTSSLELIGRSTKRRGQFLAFNAAIVKDAGGRMPSNIACNTAHSLGYRAVVGKDARFAQRLRGSKRMRPMEIARFLGVDPITIRYGSETKYLSAGYLAGLVMRAVGRFCQTADPEPTRRHVPYVEGIDVPLPGINGDELRRGYANNNEVALSIEPVLRKAWADLSDPNGVLRFDHCHYLKTWQLSEPHLGADFILFDEAQDASPVMAAIVANQDAQVVYVGDSQQEIMGFAGAMNALAGFSADVRTFLTTSFRFGEDIASIANRILGMIPSATLRLVGAGPVGTVGPVAQPDAVLCRTNAVAFETVLRYLGAGHRPHLVGGSKEIAAFAKGAKSLMDDGWTSHHELACFSAWGDVIEYVENDELGGELRLLVKLIEDHGVDVVLDATERMIPEDRADVVVSTAHKSKGRQWNAVQLAGDFPTGKDRKTGEPKMPTVEELRLLYVACTRAQRELDITGCGLLAS